MKVFAAKAKDIYILFKSFQPILSRNEEEKKYALCILYFRRKMKKSKYFIFFT